jgi:uncharacterized protein DUF2383
MSDNITSILNDLIETSKDGERGFRAAAEDTQNAELQALFLRRAGDCAAGAAELQQLVTRLGGKPEDGGSVAGAFHRGWVNLKAAETGAMRWRRPGPLCSHRGSSDESSREDQQSEPSEQRRVGRGLWNHRRISAQRQHAVGRVHCSRSNPAIGGNGRIVVEVHGNLPRFSRVENRKVPFQRHLEIAAGRRAIVAPVRDAIGRGGLRHQRACWQAREQLALVGIAWRLWRTEAVFATRVERARHRAPRSTVWLRNRHEA